MSFLGSIGKLAKRAVKAAGRPIHSAVDGLDSAVKKIPVIGKPLSATIDITLGAPLHLAEAIVQGDRIDKAAFKTLKRTVSDLRVIGPYAQAVISLTPGVGSGVSGAIGAGLALSEGQNITEAIQRGVGDAVPGGPVGKTAFNVCANAVRGKSFDVKSISIPGIPPAALERAVSATRALARGERIDHVAADEAMKAIPSEYRVAIQTGLAVGTAAVLQGNLKKAGHTMATTLAKEGERRIAKSPILQNAAVKTGKAGFSVGIELMNRSGVTKRRILAVRESIPKKDRIGFDTALALHTGAVLAPKAPSKIPQKAAAYYVALGVTGSPTIAARARVIHVSWWDQLLNYLGIGDSV